MQFGPCGNKKSVSSLQLPNSLQGLPWLHSTPCSAEMRICADILSLQKVFFPLNFKTQFLSTFLFCLMVNTNRSIYGFPLSTSESVGKCRVTTIRVLKRKFHKHYDNSLGSVQYGNTITHVSVFFPLITFGLLFIHLLGRLNDLF